MTLAFIIVALILFLLAAFNVPSPVGLGWLGLACYVGSMLVGNL